MSKEDVTSNLNAIEGSLEKIRTEMESLTSENVYKTSVKTTIHQVCTKWFEEIEPVLTRFGVPDETKTKYHVLFTTLLLLAVKTSRKATYLKTLSEITRRFQDDLVVVVMTSAGRIVSVAQMAKILEHATNEERDYLNEALGCAEHGYLRASTVLGWSAAVHRMHKIIEKLGFEEFKKKGDEMKALTEGRFKRFNKKFAVNSLSELEATVFDNDMMWVLEYWGLIDANQHERLSFCFTMRNNSAHPGEAPITEENLASFYSDLKNIVFDNPKFKL